MESSAETHFAQRLASNEKKIRDRSINKLRKWFEVRSQHKKGSFTEEDFLKLWKGLHYCMWMQDKMVIQEELADRISQLVHVFKQKDLAMKFVETFFVTEAREWDGIDRWRLDKFMMLVRCMLRQSMLYLKKAKWKKSLIAEFVDVLSHRVMDPDVTDGLKIHVTDIFIDELEKVGAEVLTAEQVIHFLEPFTSFVQKSSNTVLVNRVISRIFDAIVEQSVSDAMEAATKQLEFEGDQEVQEESEEMLELEDLDMPPRLEFDFCKIADRLFDIGKDEKCLSRNRALIYACVKKFRDLEQGILPDSDDKTEGFDPKKGYISRREFNQAISQLEALETVHNKKGKKRKKRNKDKMEIEERSDDVPEKDENEPLKVGNEAKQPPTSTKGKKDKAKNVKDKYDTDSKEDAKVGLDTVALKHKHDHEVSDEIPVKRPKKQKKKLKIQSPSTKVSEDADEHHVHFSNVDESYSYEPTEKDIAEDSEKMPRKRRKSKSDVVSDKVSVNAAQHKVGLDDVALKHSHDQDDNKSELSEIDGHHVHFSSLKPVLQTYEQENDKVIETGVKKGRKAKSQKTPESDDRIVKSFDDNQKVGLDVVELKHLHDHDQMKGGKTEKTADSSKNSKHHVQWEERTVKHIYKSENDDLKQTNEVKDQEGLEGKDSQEKEGDRVKRSLRKRKSSDGKMSQTQDESSKHVGYDVVALKHLHDNEGEVNVESSATKSAKRKAERKESKSSTDSIDESESRNEVSSAQDDDSKLADSEIEIWVPNKKYKGKLAKQIEEQIIKAEGDSKPKRSPKTRAEKAASQNFAKFDDLKKSPPAFVRKAVSKATPKTTRKTSNAEETQTVELSSTPLSSDKKKVVFNMKKNQARDFKDSINFSPEPFNPHNTPEHGILKTPEVVRTPRTRASSAKKLRGSVKKRK
ncbi:hypothetical protein FSP39_001584 [Pinctada imbricata]|uniref:Uncharacterized protein n=1 Tax=Pinctada imbricata TaxID=66713 RepID=A0AA89C9H6_PINIB|nr:hypothetical protein FSP39_001584 [Pinctada imbricata]